MAKNNSESITLLEMKNNGTATFAPTVNLRASLPATVTYTCTPLNEEDNEIFKQVLQMKHTAKIKDGGEVTVRFELDGGDIDLVKGDGNVTVTVKPKKEDKKLFDKACMISVRTNGRMTCQVAFACKKVTKRSLNPEVSDR